MTEFLIWRLKPQRLNNIWKYCCSLSPSESSDDTWDFWFTWRPKTQDSDQWQNHKWFATVFSAQIWWVRSQTVTVTRCQNHKQNIALVEPKDLRWISWGHGSIQRIHGRTPCWACRRTPPAASRSRLASHGTTCRLSELFCSGTWGNELLDNRRRMNTINTFKSL